MSVYGLIFYIYGPWPYPAAFFAHVLGTGEARRHPAGDAKFAELARSGEGLVRITLHLLLLVPGETGRTFSFVRSLSLLLV